MAYGQAHAAPPRPLNTERLSTEDRCSSSLPSLDTAHTNLSYKIVQAEDFFSFSSLTRVYHTATATFSSS
jgi:hypothetical protein